MRVFTSVVAVLLVAQGLSAHADLYVCEGKTRVFVF